MNYNKQFSLWVYHVRWSSLLDTFFNFYMGPTVHAVQRLRGHLSAGQFNSRQYITDYSLTSSIKLYLIQRLMYNKDNPIKTYKNNCTKTVTCHSTLNGTVHFLLHTFNNLTVCIQKLILQFTKHISSLSVVCN